MSKDTLARVGVVVAIVIAIIGCFTPVGRQAGVRAGTILDTFSGDYFNATTGFQIAGVTIIGPTTFSLPSGVTSQTVNGITTTYSRVSALSTATTTPCAIQSPAATTTLEVFTLNVTTGTSSAGTVTLATSTTAYATTSLITTKAIAASAQGTVNWHGGNDNTLVAPSTWVVAGVSGVSYGYTYGGTCNATFRSVN